MNDKMENLDLAYLAGLLDGEGCVGIYENHENGGMHYDYNLTIANSFRPVLDWVQETTRIGTVYEKKHPNTHLKDMYVWTVHKMGDIHSFLLMVEPYIKIKKEQVGIMITVTGLRIEQLKIARLTHAYVPCYSETEQELVELLRGYNKKGRLEYMMRGEYGNNY